MANYRKSFNFRSGVQVDNDNFIVNANGLVGIGTSIPTESLDLIGNAKISGFATATTLGVGETATFSGEVKVGSGISFNPSSGDVIATRFVGDASGLTNIYAISTTGWVAQGVGLHTFRSVGVGTTNPEYSLQIGKNPLTSSGVAIESIGNIRASGVITASSFDGDITGNVKGNIAGDLTGVASTATKLENSRDFSITGDLEASAVSFDGTENVTLNSSLSNSFSANTSGIITANTLSGMLTSSNATISTGSITNANITNADVGIGTFDEIRIDNTTDSSLVITSDQSSIISIGASVGAGNSSVEIKYDASTGDFNVSNYDLGDISFNLHSGSGIGNTGGFKVKYDNTNIINATYDGRVSINKNTPDSGYNLDVSGDVKLNNSGVVLGILTVGSGANEITIGDGSYFPIDPTTNFDINAGVSTFNELEVSGSIKPVNPATPLGIGVSLLGGDAVGVGSDFVDIFTNVQVALGYTAFAPNLSVDNYINIQTVTGTGGSISADIDNTSNSTKLGITSISQKFSVNNNGQEDILVDTGKVILNQYETGFVGIGTDQNNYPQYKLEIESDTIVNGSMAVDFSSEGRFGLLYGSTFREDPRTSVGFYDPPFQYGDLQIDTNISTLIFDGFLSLVPGPGQVGGDNRIIADLDGAEQTRLTMVGINTYHPRSILDIGVGSTTMNSYFIPPSLTQTELNIVKNLWQNTSGLGTIRSRRLTPNGVVPGALIYNKTSQRLEIGTGNSEFSGIPVLEQYYDGATPHEFLVHPPYAGSNPESASGVPDGATYYNTSTDKLRLKANGVWVSLN